MIRKTIRLTVECPVCAEDVEVEAVRVPAFWEIDRCDCPRGHIAALWQPEYDAWIEEVSAALDALK